MSKRNGTKALPAPATAAPDVNPEEIAAESFRLAVRHYHEAEARYEHVRTQYSITMDPVAFGDRLEDPRLRRLYQLEAVAEQALAGASESLCYAIQLLSPGETLRRLNRLGQDWVNRGAVYRGRLYISNIGETEDSGRPLLLIVDMDQVATIGD